MFEIDAKANLPAKASLVRIVAERNTTALPRGPLQPSIYNVKWRKGWDNRVAHLLTFRQLGLASRALFVRRYRCRGRTFANSLLALNQQKLIWSAPKVCYLSPQLTPRWRLGHLSARAVPVENKKFLGDLDWVGTLRRMAEVRGRTLSRTGTPRTKTTTPTSLGG
jgi:hypothetical protein